MSNEAAQPESDRPRSTERVRMSCPGCGRGDWVSWPVGETVFHWKCFNCSKEFDLTQDGGH